MLHDHARRTSIAIIGGGIGGLTAAACLLRAGFNVQVYEQTSTLREVTLALILALTRRAFYIGWGSLKRLKELALSR